MLEKGGTQYRFKTMSTQWPTVYPWTKERPLSDPRLMGPGTTIILSSMDTLSMFHEIPELKCKATTIKAL